VKIKTSKLYWSTLFYYFKKYANANPSLCNPRGSEIKQLEKTCTRVGNADVEAAIGDNKSRSFSVEAARVFSK